MSALNDLSLILHREQDKGGFTGSYEDMLEFVNRFLDETAYQLCDGYASVKMTRIAENSPSKITGIATQKGICRTG